MTASKQAQFVQELLNLNEQFHRWVGEQQQHHAAELWLDGAEAYIKHAKQLLGEYKSVLDQATPQQANGTTSAPTQPPSFAFGAASTTATAAAAAAPPPAAFSWGAPSSTPAFSFGGATPATGGAFAFGGSGTAAATPGGGEDDEDEVEEEAPAEVEIEGADAIDVLFTDQATLKQLDPVKKKWSNKGTGRVSLRREKDTGIPYLVFTSGSGKVLCTFRLRRSQTASVGGKGNITVTTSYIGNGPGGSTGAQHAAFLFKTEEVARAFSAACLANAPTT